MASTSLVLHLPSHQPIEAGSECSVRPVHVGFGSAFDRGALQDQSMATAMALQTCSWVMQSGLCEQPVPCVEHFPNSSSQGLPGPRIPDNWSRRSLKILEGVSRRRSCPCRAQVTSTGKTRQSSINSVEKTRQPSINGTAKAVAASPVVMEEPTYGRQYIPLATVLPQEDEVVEEDPKQQQQQQQQVFVAKGHWSSKRYAVSQGRRVQTLAGYTAMIIVYTRTGRYKEAERMIEEMDFHGVLPDKSNWLVRIAAYGQQGKVREAEKVFKGMQESGISPDTVAFNSMIVLYGKARMYDRAYTTFQNMLEIGGKPDEYTFRSMIGACGKSGKLKDALQLFAEMRELNFQPSSQNFSTLINLYGKARNVGGIVRAIQEMKEIGCKPEAHTLDACLRAIDRAGKLYKNLDKLLSCLKGAGWSADAASYGPLLTAYLKCHMHKDALETFYLMRKANLIPKESLCRELISQCKDAGKVEGAEYVFSEIEAAGITPRLETTCTMINALGLIGKVQEAELLYNKLRSSGEKLDIVVYNVMIDVYMRSGSPQEAALIFETIEQKADVTPDSYTFHGMLRVYQKAGLYQEAVELYWKMVQAGIQLDEGMLNCVINCCGRTLPLDETTRLFQEMLDAGFCPNVVTFNLMIDIYGKAGMLESACDVFNISKKYGKVDSITYSTLINFYGKQRDFAGMEATAWEMQRMGLGCWVEAYNSMIDAYGKAGLFNQMEEVRERMQRAGCHCDVLTYNILINVYGKKGLLEDQQRVMGEMEENGKERDLWTYNTLIETYGHAEMPDQVMSTFKEMQEVGLMPDRITYKNLVAAFEKSGNLWEAARWSVWMTQAGFSTSYSSG